MAVVSLALLLTACSTLRPTPTAVDEKLSADERELAHALAHYARAVLIEGEHGRTTDDALHHLGEAEKLDPSRHALDARLAAAYLTRGKTDRALAILEESCRTADDPVAAHLDLAAACQITGDAKRAEENYRRAMRLAPERTDIPLILANMLFVAQRDADALDLTERALKHGADREYVKGYVLSRAMYFVDAGEPDRAIACLQHVAREFPDERSRVYYAIGEVYAQTRNSREARRWYGRALRAPNPVAQAFVSAAYDLRDDDPDRALEILLAASRVHTNDTSVLLTLAHFQMQSERFADAVSVLAQAEPAVRAAKDPELTHDFLLQYGAACERAKQYAHAEEIFERGIAAFPRSHEMLNYLAYTWAERGEKLDRAMAYVDRALKEEPGNGAYIDTKGWILFKQGKYSEARAILEDAHTRMPEDSTIADHLGDACLKLGQTDQAVLYWTRSYATDPKNTAVAQKLREHNVNPEAIVPKALSTPTEPDPKP